MINRNILKAELTLYEKLTRGNLIVVNKLKDVLEILD